ncbi:MAG: amino acid adenylation domain-containing protein, partial [Acidobacteriota bacterium]
FEDQTLSYRELNNRANQLAHYLQAMGVGPETLVGICVERSIELIIGLLGILKAGGAYLPIDPQLPTERLGFMLHDAGLSILLTESGLIDTLPMTRTHLIYLDDNWKDIACQCVDNPVNTVLPDQLAYLIYTSGSTGKPKGVQVTHQSVSNLLHSMQAVFELCRDDVLLAVTTLSFDIAGLELYLPIIVGAQVVIANTREITDGKALIERITQANVSVMQATPATWRLLLTAGWQGNKRLKILCGGEALSNQLAKQLLEKSCSVWNLYGPTETTIWSCIYHINSDELPATVLIGRAIGNTTIYILDGYYQPTPVGVPGEVYIGGVGVARGYYDRFELTAEKFIPNPFSAEGGARLYKTGDLARYLIDGNIEFLGRIDQQVKIRGFRIELGEIEAVLAQYPYICENAILVQEDSSGEKRLIAYLVTENEEALTISDLRNFLKQRLPDYMIPSTFVALAALPLTPNGKLDRRALLELAEGRVESGKEFVAPRTAVEEILAGIWSSLFDIEQISITDNFFDLGGHSLLATQLISRLRKRFEIELPLRMVFAGPTIAAMAAEITTLQ